MWQGGLEHGPTRIPVLKGQGVPVGPAGPGQAGGVGGGVEVLAEANPGVSGEILGDSGGAVRSDSGQVFETGLTGCERSQSVRYEVIN